MGRRPLSDEQWLELHRETRNRRNIVAISNTGKYRREDGSIGILGLRQQVSYGDKRMKCYHLIAEYFLITVRRPDQNQIDHITHNPTEYNVNDVRNLRWCTQPENLRFEEARANQSKAMIGLLVGEKNPMYGRTGEKNPMYGRTGEKNPMYGRREDKCPRWKGDDVGPSGAYKRAKNRYKHGEISEYEMKIATDEWNRYRRINRR